jgi:hypothetical protein
MGLRAALWLIAGELAGLIWAVEEIRDALRDIAHELAKAHLH